MKIAQDELIECAKYSNELRDRVKEIDVKMKRLQEARNEKWGW